MFWYSVAGLTVASEFELPGFSAACDGRPADVAVRLGPVPFDLDAPDASGPTWRLAGDLFLLRIPGIARFLLRGGREVMCEPEAAGRVGDLAPFFEGTAFGLLLHQRGEIILHASAVEVGGKAVLFCGRSGAGKSTLAAALVRRGHALVSDDLCAIRLAEAPKVQPDGGRLRLWAQAIQRLGLEGRRGGPLREGLEKFHVEPDGRVRKELPLGAVYELRESRPPHDPGIARPNVVDAVLMVQRNAYRSGIVARMGQKDAYFLAATSMAAHAGVFHLTRPLDFDAMPEVISWLERRWAELGLTDGAVG